MRFVLNGRPCDVKAPPLERLLDVLREDCQLTGTKEGCGEGECGACTVLLDGEAVCACLVPFAQVRGRSVTTIEDDDLIDHPLPNAFVAQGGAQCGICTPGMILSALALYRAPARRRRAPSLAEVREALAGNLCRCTGYTAIFRSVLAAWRGKRRRRGARR